MLEKKSSATEIDKALCGACAHKLYRSIKMPYIRLSKLSLQWLSADSSVPENIARQASLTLFWLRRYDKNPNPPPDEYGTDGGTSADLLKWTYPDLILEDIDRPNWFDDVERLAERREWVRAHLNLRKRLGF